MDIPYKFGFDDLAVNVLLIIIFKGGIPLRYTLGIDHVFGNKIGLLEGVAHFGIDVWKGDE